MTIPVNVMQIELPLQAEFIAVARLAVSAYTRRLLPESELLEDIITAVGEACTHALTYTYVYDRQQEPPYLIVECQCDPRTAMAVTVRHARKRCPGDGIWQHQGPYPSDQDLSLLLVRVLMDEVTLHCSSETGIELVMVKRIAGMPDDANAVSDDIYTNDTPGGIDVSITG